VGHEETASRTAAANFSAAQGDGRRVLTLDHHAQQRFSPGSTQQYAPTAVEFTLDLALRGADQRVLFPGEALAQRDVDQLLRIELQTAQELLQIAAFFPQCRKHLQGGDDAVTGRVPVEAENVAGVFPPKEPALLPEQVHDVAVTDGRTHERHLEFSQCVLESEIAHQGANHTCHGALA
jgi:hypothetical protein